MSDAEGLMWRLEKDPHLSSTFGNVTILDRRPDFDRLRARMERALAETVITGLPHTVPFLRRLIVDEPFLRADLHTGYIGERMEHLLSSVRLTSTAADDAADRDV